MEAEPWLLFLSLGLLYLYCLLKAFGPKPQPPKEQCRICESGPAISALTALAKRLEDAADRLTPRARKTKEKTR